MKNLITRTLTPVLLGVLLVAGTAWAQRVRRTARMDVPFDFTVNDKSFPAGEYSIVRTAPDRLDLCDAHGRVLASLVTHQVQSAVKTPANKLEFSGAGGGHVLTQVWFEGELIGNELAPSNPRKPVEVSSGGNK
jgi:hypothetical protein